MTCCVMINLSSVCPFTPKISSACFSDADLKRAQSALRRLLLVYSFILSFSLSLSLLLSVPLLIVSFKVEVCWGVITLSVFCWLGTVMFPLRKVSPPSVYRFRISSHPGKVGLIVVSLGWVRTTTQLQSDYWVNQVKDGNLRLRRTTSLM